MYFSVCTKLTYTHTDDFIFTVFKLNKMKLVYISTQSEQSLAQFVFISFMSVCFVYMCCRCNNMIQ